MTYDQEVAQRTDARCRMLRRLKGYMPNLAVCAQCGINEFVCCSGYEGMILTHPLCIICCPTSKDK